MRRQTGTNNHINKCMGINCDEFLEEKIQVTEWKTRVGLFDKVTSELRSKEWYFTRRNWEKSISVCSNSMYNRAKENKAWYL